MHSKQSTEAFDELLGNLQSQTVEGKYARLHQREQRRGITQACLDLLDNGDLPAARQFMAACEQKGLTVTQHLSALEGWLSVVHILKTEDRAPMLPHGSSLSVVAPEMVLKIVSRVHPRLAHCFSSAFFAKLRPMQMSLSYSRKKKEDLDLQTPVIAGYNAMGVFPPSEMIPAEEDLSEKEILSPAIAAAMRETSLKYADVLRDGSRWTLPLKQAVIGGIEKIQRHAGDLEKTTHMAEVVRSQLFHNSASEGPRIGRAALYVGGGKGPRKIRKTTDQGQP